MSDTPQMRSRVVEAVHGRREANGDGNAESAMADRLREQFDREVLVELYGRHARGWSRADEFMRRALCRALFRRVGRDVDIGVGVAFKNAETFEVGDGVFIGAQTYIQGWYKGRFCVGDHVWIGPQSYFDARDTVIEDYVGWGPGAKILTSRHTGVPLEVPIIQTDLEIQTVKIERWADVGTNAVVMPGITVGRASIVGAGAVVTRDVPPFAVVAGVPARFLRWRDGYHPENDAEHAEKVSHGAW